jgi:hypothetical protein
VFAALEYQTVAGSVAVRAGGLEIFQVVPSATHSRETVIKTGGEVA